MMPHHTDQYLANTPWGLYIHWPFCQAKCPYCDFNSHVSKNIDHDEWANAYMREIEKSAQHSPGKYLTSIYFGGGTPSLMQPKTVDKIITQARKYWNFTNNIEITLEANPTSVEAQNFHGYKQAGVNRISMGIQALNDQDLKLLGRMHSVDEALNALDIANHIFDRVNFDLIYARQNQTLENWQAELQRAISLSSGHLSLYQLTVEQGTVFGERHNRGLLHGLPGEDLGADFYELTQQLCDEAGLFAYEVSNHAKEGYESQHNLIYWRSGYYIGLGPGAHGRISINNQRIPTFSTKSPNDWLAETKSAKGAVQYEPALSAEEHMIEFLLMGLRLKTGISIDLFSNLFHKKILTQNVLDLVQMNMLIVENDHLKTTDKGRIILNSILENIICAL